MVGHEKSIAQFSHLFPFNISTANMYCPRFESLLGIDILPQQPPLRIILHLVHRWIKGRVRVSKQPLHCSSICLCRLDSCEQEKRSNQQTTQKNESLYRNGHRESMVNYEHSYNLRALSPSIYVGPNVLLTFTPKHYIIQKSFACNCRINFSTYYHTVSRYK